MADIKIKIKIQEGTEDDPTGVSSSQPINNVSGTLSLPSTKNDGVNGLSFSQNYLTFKDGYLANFDRVSGVAQMERGYNGFMFGAVPSSKLYSLTLTISGTNIDSLIFYGDKTANQFPTEAYIGSDTSNKIYSDDFTWVVKFPTTASSQSITFTKWNRANYNACITHIGVLLNEIELDKSWIKSIESLSQSTASPNEIFYGVLPNSGSAEIIDRNGEILDLITDGVVDNSNLPITIYANGKEVQHHIINDSDYDKNTTTLNVQMNNDLENWDLLKYDGFQLLNSETSAYYMLKYVFASLYKREGMIYGTEYFNLTNGYIEIDGIEGQSETVLFSNNQIDYINGHKYYVCYYAMTTYAPMPQVKTTSTQLFFPVVEGNDIGGNVGDTYTRVSGFVQNTNVQTGKQYFRLDNNGFNGEIRNVIFKDIIIYDLTANGLENKTKEWCDKNLDIYTKIDNMLDTQILYGNNNIGTVKQYLSSIYIPYPYLTKDTYKNTIEKFCNLAQLKVFKNSNNEIKFINARPVATTNEKNNCIIINSKYQSFKFENSLILKNKFDNVKYYINNISMTNASIDNGQITYSFLNNSSSSQSVQNVFLNNYYNKYYDTSSIVTQIDGSDTYQYQRTILDFDISDLILSTNNILNSKLSFTSERTDVGWSPTRNQTWSNSNTENANMNREYGGNKILSYNKNLINLRTDNFYSHSGPTSIVSAYGTLLHKNISLFIECIKSEYEPSFINNNSGLIYEYNECELIQQDTKIGNEHIYEVNSNNILSDYSNGISNATITVVCGDYYNTNGIKVKDWSQGDLIEVGDVVRVDKDNNGNSASVYADGTPRIWRVTGRKFRKQGVPLIDLELQEIKQ